MNLIVTAKPYDADDPDTLVVKPGEPLYAARFDKIDVMNDWGYLPKRHRRWIERWKRTEMACRVKDVGHIIEHSEAEDR